MSRAASIAGFEDPLGDDNDCGICLENELDVAVNGCKHKLCIDCAIRYCLCWISAVLTKALRPEFPVHIFSLAMDVLVSDHPSFVARCIMIGIGEGKGDHTHPLDNCG